MSIRITVAIVGVSMALWMSAGRWVFGLGGSLTWWYVPTIGLVFAALQLWIVQRLRITHQLGYRSSRATIVSLLLSWLCALGFGVTVPDLVDGQLQSVMGVLDRSGFLTELSIALCNPLGVIAFACAIAVVILARLDARAPGTVDDGWGAHSAPDAPPA